MIQLLHIYTLRESIVRRYAANKGRSGRAAKPELVTHSLLTVYCAFRNNQHIVDDPVLLQSLELSGSHK